MSASHLPPDAAANVVVHALRDAVTGRDHSPIRAIVLLQLQDAHSPLAEAVRVTTQVLYGKGYALVKVEGSP